MGDFPFRSLKMGGFRLRVVRRAKMAGWLIIVTDM